MSARIWIQAARPKTLAAAVTPVLIGSAIARADGAYHNGVFIAALLGAILIQIGTNYANDYFDFAKGADDDATRLGPTRAVAAGQVSPKAMRTAFLLVFLLAIAVGAYLVWHAGWPVVVIGLVGVALGILYTGGPAPLAYVGLGDLAVLVYFGPVAVAGTYFVHARTWSAESVVAGLGPGFLATALLAINNLRDVDQDREANKRTLTVRFGRQFAKFEIYACFAGAMLIPAVLVVAFGQYAGFLATSLLPLLIGSAVLYQIRRAQPGDRLDDALKGMGLVLLFYGLAFAGMWLA